MSRYTKNELLDSKDAKRDFLREVESKRGWYDLKTNELLGNAMGLSKSTMRLRMLDPDSLTIRELRSMIRVLHLDIWTVIRFVGFQIKEINKARKEGEETQCLTTSM